MAMLALLVVSGCSRPSAAATARFCGPTPGVVAHRGGTEKSLENTLGAFRAAGTAGITRWELDVRWDKRGTPVILHDATVDRISPRSGPVAELDATGGGGIPTDDGQRIPTLREVYAEAAKYHATVLTELKVMPTPAQWRRLTQEIDRSIGRDSVVLISFGKEIIRTAREQVKNTETGLLYADGNPGAAGVQQYGDNFLKAHDRIDAKRARAWAAAGLTLYLWTPDDPKDWDRIVRLPVTWVITDRPIAYRAWAAAQCGAPRNPT